MYLPGVSLALGSSSLSVKFTDSRLVCPLTGPRMGLVAQLDLNRKPIQNVTVERRRFERGGEMVKYLLWFSDEEFRPLLDIFISDARADENVEVLKSFFQKSSF